MSNHQDWPWRRVTGILGILLFVGAATGLLIIIPTQPAPNEPIANIREFFAEDSALFHSANLIMMLTLVFVFLPFAAGLRSVLAEKDVDAGMWSRTAFGIAVGIVAVTGAGSAFLSSTMLAFQPGSFDDAVLRVIVYADAYMFSVIITVGLALFLVATAIVVLRTGALWKWLGWLGLVIALIGLIGTSWPLDGDPEGMLASMGYSSFPLFAIWSLLVGINLLQTPTAAAETTAA